MRSQILAAFEAADEEPNPEQREAWPTFVVVGGGPAGVEMAGQIGELARDTLPRDFRAIDTRSGRILLVEAAERLLTGFPTSLSEKAMRSLRRLGVTSLLDSTVVDIDSSGVTIKKAGGARKRIPARTVVWAAGVNAPALASQLAELTGAVDVLESHLATTHDLRVVLAHRTRRSGLRLAAGMDHVIEHDGRRYTRAHAEPDMGPA